MRRCIQWYLVSRLGLGAAEVIFLSRITNHVNDNGLLLCATFSAFSVYIPALIIARVHLTMCCFPIMAIVCISIMSNLPVLCSYELALQKSDESGDFFRVCRLHGCMLLNVQDVAERLSLEDE